MNVQPEQIQRCVAWIYQLDKDALHYLAQILTEGGKGDPTGVAALLPTKPPDREGGAEAELLWDTE